MSSYGQNWLAGVSRLWRRCYELWLTRTLSFNAADVLQPTPTPLNTYQLFATRQMRLLAVLELLPRFKRLEAVELQLPGNFGMPALLALRHAKQLTDLRLRPLGRLEMPLELSQLRLLPPTLVRLRLGAFLPLLEGSVYIWPNDAFPALESLHLEAHLTMPRNPVLRNASTGPCPALRRFEFRVTFERDIDYMPFFDHAPPLDCFFFDAYPNVEMVHIEPSDNTRDCLAPYQNLARLRTANLYVSITARALNQGLAFDRREEFWHLTLTCLELSWGDEAEHSYGLYVDLSSLPLLRCASLSGHCMDFPTGIPSSLEKLMLQTDLNRMECEVDLSGLTLLVVVHFGEAIGGEIHTHISMLPTLKPKKFLLQERQGEAVTSAEGSDWLAQECRDEAGWEAMFALCEREIIEFHIHDPDDETGL